MCKAYYASIDHSLELVSSSRPYLQVLGQKSEIPMDRLMTIEEVAAYMQVSRFTVYRLAKGQSIPATKIGRQWRFQKEEIDRWMREQFRKERRQSA